MHTCTHAHVHNSASLVHPPPGLETSWLSDVGVVAAALAVKLRVPSSGTPWRHPTSARSSCKGRWTMHWRPRRRIGRRLATLRRLWRWVASVGVGAFAHEPPIVGRWGCVCWRVSGQRCLRARIRRLCFGPAPVHYRAVPIMCWLCAGEGAGCSQEQRAGRGDAHGVIVRASGALRSVPLGCVAACRSRKHCVVTDDALPVVNCAACSVGRG